MSKWTKVMLFAVVLGIVSAGTASAAIFSDDFNRADADNLGANWGYFSNEANPAHPPFHEQMDPTAGILSNEAYPIDPPDNPNFPADPNDPDNLNAVDNATQQFRAYYAGHEITGAIVAEVDFKHASWDGLILHQYKSASNEGYYRYAFETVFRNNPGDTYGGMRIRKMSSTSEIAGYFESGIGALEALEEADTWYKARATSDNAGNFTYSILSQDGLTTHYTVSWTDPSPYTGGYAGIRFQHGRMDNFLLTPEPATMAVLLVGAVGFMLRRRR